MRRRQQLVEEREENLLGESSLFELRNVEVGLAEELKILLRFGGSR